MLRLFCTCVPSLNAKIHVLCRMLCHVRGDISGRTALTMYRYVALVVKRSPCLLVCYVTHSSSVSLCITACSELRKVLFLFVYEISRQLLNGFAPNSQGRRVWSVAWTSLNVKVNDHGHQGQKTGFSADISGLAELICDKFTRRTCLVTDSDKFEG